MQDPGQNSQMGQTGNLPQVGQPTNQYPYGAAQGQYGYQGQQGQYATNPGAGQYASQAQAPHGPGAYQNPQGQYAYQARPGQNVYQATGAAGTNPTIVVNVPTQKSSKAPTIILIVILSLFLLLTCIGLFSCASAISGFSSGALSTPATTGDTVAVIHMEGTIMSSGSGYITPENVLSELQAAEQDDHVKAIVLRIDSGGGSAAAGEEITRYVRDCDKPVVISCGDMCCSAAYRIASQGDWIIASDGTTIGSIGTIITKYDISALLADLGISVDSISSGEDKADLDIYSALTPEQRQYYQDMVNQITEGFITDVAEGRGIDRETVAQLATGQIWTGTQALDYGMIDQVGTYDDAINKAAELGGCSSDYEVVSFDQDSTLSSLGL